MSEELASPSGPSGAGLLLRQAREAAGLHQDTVAAALKVPVRKLEALEGDRWDLLPDAVFTRALAASMCRVLKIDPQPVLERLPQVAAPRLVAEADGINTPFRTPGDAAAPHWFDHLTRPPVLAVGALLVGALVLVLLPSLRIEPPTSAAARADSAGVPMAAGEQAASVASQPAAAGEPVAAASVPAPSAVVASAPAPVATAAPAVAAAPAAAPAAVPTPAPPPAVAAAPASRAVPAVAAAATASAPAAASVPSAAAGAGVNVSFRATAPSWVQVVDAAGVVALRRELAAGEAASAAGQPPLVVTVGNAGATAVQVRGRAFDLGSVARDNVARFEVK